MKISKWLVIGMAAAMTVGGAMVVKARAANAPISRFGHGRFLARAKEKLNLTDAQVAQIKTILNANKEKLSILLAAAHTERVALRKTIQTPGITEEKVRAASAKVAVTAADLAVERAVLYSQISPILTADQLEKIGEFQDRMDDFIDDTLAGFAKRLAQ